MAPASAAQTAGLPATLQACAVPPLPTATRTLRETRGSVLSAPAPLSSAETAAPTQTLCCLLPGGLPQSPHQCPPAGSQTQQLLLFLCHPRRRAVGACTSEGSSPVAPGSAFLFEERTLRVTSTQCWHQALAQNHDRSTRPSVQLRTCRTAPLGTSDTRKTIASSKVKNTRGHIMAPDSTAVQLREATVLMSGKLNVTGAQPWGPEVTSLVPVITCRHSPSRRCLSSAHVRADART